MNVRPDTARHEVQSPGPGGRPQDAAWLARPSTIRLLWRVFIVALALVLVAQLIFPVKGRFGVDGWLGFGAVFGFLSCLARVLFAKALGWILKRDENYYQDQASDD